MRIVFVDFIDWEYTPNTPWERPIGGAQSGVCYLSQALATLGHQVFLINNTKEFIQCRGVQCIPLNLNAEYLKKIFGLIQPDHVVVLSSASASTELRSVLPENTQLHLWCHHAVNQPHYESLTSPSIKQAWDRFIFVGSWQRDTVCELYQLDVTKTVNLGMAIAPAFEAQFLANEPIIPHKSSSPTLIYTSTPFRGLDVLLDCFPAIRQQIPNAKLRIFSSMKLYQIDEQNDQFANLYEQCKAMNGVEYVGPVSQPQLAKEIKSAIIHAYPNTFAETACIAVMEALASGCAVVSSHLGSLPETCAGFAKLVPAKPGTTPYREQFVEAVVSICRGLHNAKENQLESHLRAQVDYCQKHYQWNVRATQWARWLSLL